MHPHFAEVVDSLHPSFTKLLEMSPVTTSTLPKDAPKSGVYLFTENGKHLYVGRSNRLPKRVRNHGSEGSKENVAAFAFKIARRTTGNIKATYKLEGSRKELMKQPKFIKAFHDAKGRVSKMEVRFIEESNQLKQAVLEMYVCVALETPFNDFDTH